MWRLNKIHGNGISYTDGLIDYNGEWLSDAKNGDGVIYIRDKPVKAVHVNDVCIFLKIDGYWIKANGDSDLESEDERDES